MNIHQCKLNSHFTLGPLVCQMSSRQSQLFLVAVNSCLGCLHFIVKVCTSKGVVSVTTDSDSTRLNTDFSTDTDDTRLDTDTTPLLIRQDGQSSPQHLTKHQTTTSIHNKHCNTSTMTQSLSSLVESLSCSMSQIIVLSVVTVNCGIVTLVSRLSRLLETYITIVIVRFIVPVIAVVVNC